MKRLVCFRTHERMLAYVRAGSWMHFNLPAQRGIDTDGHSVHLAVVNNYEHAQRLRGQRYDEVDVSRADDTQLMRMIELICQR